jgi:deazaflavin-dependent oxidoreductase (nitroreductase family)
MSDWNDWTKRLKEELRTKGEIAEGPMAGRPLLILTSTGAHSGERREAILTFTRDRDAYVVAGTASGSPRTPAWVHNLAANPDAQIEANGRTIQVRATIVDEAERQRLWDAHVAERPEFAEYPEKAGRIIPVVRLEPIS